MSDLNLTFYNKGILSILEIHSDNNQEISEALSNIILIEKVENKKKELTLKDFIGAKILEYKQ